MLCCQATSPVFITFLFLLIISFSSALLKCLPLLLKVHLEFYLQLGLDWMQTCPMERESSLFFFSDLFLHFLYMSVSVCMYMSVSVCGGIRSFGGRIIGDWEPPDMGAGKEWNSGPLEEWVSSALNLSCL